MQSDSLKSDTLHLSYTSSEGRFDVGMGAQGLETVLGITNQPGQRPHNSQALAADAASLGYVALADDQQLWASFSTDKDAQGFSFGGFSNSNQDSDYRSYGLVAQQKFQPVTWGQLSLTTGSLVEEGGFLGTEVRGAFANEFSASSFGRVAGALELSPWAQLTAAYSVAGTRVEANDQKLLQDYSMLLSDSFAVSLVSDTIFTKHDSLSFTLSSPMRVFAGEAVLAAPVGFDADQDYAVIYDRQNVDLSPSGRELRFALGYDQNWSEDTQFSLGLMASHQPGHDKNADMMYGGYVGLKVAF